jgi:membrane associated rhomboid family serine protease
MSQDSPYSGFLVDLVRSAPRTPLTSLAVVACIGVWLGISVGEPLQQPQDWARWGVYASPVLIEHAWWGLLTSCFVHVDFWHVAFNVYWLWVLGSRIEMEIGSWRYGALSLVAGAVSMLGQALASDGASHGYSGIDYALFGVALGVGKRWPALRAVLTTKAIMVWGAWSVLGIVLAYFDVLAVANTAHAVGFAVGLAWAWLSSGRHVRGVALGAATVLALTVAMFWRPWSPHWNYVEGFGAHRTGEFARARRHYEAMIRSGGDEAWARAALAHLHYVRGDLGKHRLDLERARALDPSKADWAAAAAKYLDYTREWTPQMTDPQRQALVRAALAEAEWRYADARAAYREYIARFPAEYDNKLRLAKLADADLLASRAEIEEAMALALEVESKDEALASAAKELRERLETRRR